MLFSIIIAAAGLFGLYSLSLTRDYYARFIVMLMVVSIVLTLLPVPNIKTIGFVVYLVSLVLTMVYALLKTGTGNARRFTMLVMALPPFLALLFQLNQWPYVKLLYGTCLLSLLAFVYILFAKRKAYQNELGMLTIIAADALIHVWMFFQWDMYKVQL